MNRLFIFGCSFSAYSWPMYSDLLAMHFDEYHNWALSGIGNRAIAERFIEGHNTLGITKDDTVIVQWSSHLRNDFFSVAPMNKKFTKERKPGWRTNGSLFNYWNMSLYDQDWFDNFFYEPAYFMHTLNNISLVQNVLENIGCTWYMTSMGDVRNLGTDLNHAPSYGENVLEFDDDIEDYPGWVNNPHLKNVYEKPIWEDRADHWLEPLATWTQKHFPGEFYKFKVIDADTHPPTHQQAAWIKDQFEGKLDLDEVSINNVVDIVNDIYESCNNNKMVFEKRLYLREDLRNAPKFRWPNRPQGITE